MPQKVTLRVDFTNIIASVDIIEKELTGLNKVITDETERTDTEIAKYSSTDHVQAPGILLILRATNL